MKLNYTPPSTYGAYYQRAEVSLPEQSSKLLRPKEAAMFLGISRTTLWRLYEIDPSFPRKVVVSSRCVGWRLDALSHYMTNKEQQS